MRKIFKDLRGGGNDFGPILNDSIKAYQTQDQDPEVEDETTESATTASKIPICVLPHYSPAKMVWDWLILVLVLYTAVATPYVAAFSLHEQHLHLKNMDIPESHKAQPLYMWYFDWVVDITFILDILINFRTTYVEDGEIVTSPKKIAVNYFKGWFFIDAVAAIPFDLTFRIIGKVESEKMAVTGLLKTPRLLRLLRIARRVDQYSEYGAAVLLLLMFSFTLVAHWLACIFYTVAYLERKASADPLTWLDGLYQKYEYVPHPNSTVMDRLPDLRSSYLTALYFTFTSLTSIGFGNVAPGTNSEKIFTIFSMLIGALLNAAIFGNASSIMLRLYQGTEEYHELNTSIKEFIKFHHLPKTLANRLVESFQNTWAGISDADMIKVLKAFPDSVQADICLHLNKTFLDKSDVFKSISPGCLRCLCTRMKSLKFPPGDTLLHTGDLLDQFYFIARGTIEILQDDVLVAILGKNDVIGKPIETLSEENIDRPEFSNFTVRTLSYCDLHKVYSRDIKEIMCMYPEYKKQFKFALTSSFDLTMHIQNEKTYPPPDSLKRTGTYESVFTNTDVMPSPCTSEESTVRMQISMHNTLMHIDDLTATVRKLESNWNSTFHAILVLLADERVAPEPDETLTGAPSTSTGITRSTSAWASIKSHDTSNFHMDF